MITHDNKEIKCYSYYHFKTLFDNKHAVMITHDNKEIKCYSYYHFKTLFDNRGVFHEC